MALVNRALFAGRWYRDEPAGLERDLQQFRAEAAATEASSEVGAEQPAPVVTAAVLPHAGLAYSGRGISHAFLDDSISEVTRVLILSPSHYEPLLPNHLYVETFDHHQTPLGDLPGFPALGKTLLDIGSGMVVAADSTIEREHGTEMFLPFIRKWIGRPEVAMVLVPPYSEETVLHEWARLLARGLGESAGEPVHPGLLVIMSSDFTHYGRRFGYTPFGAATVREDDLDFARMVTDDDTAGLERRMERPLTICGRYPIRLGMELSRLLYQSDTDDRRVSKVSRSRRVADYYTSRDVTGLTDPDFVCYCTILFEEARP
jgi:MEMO1 family protein